jgi:hypothetical protein
MFAKLCRRVSADSGRIVDAAERLAVSTLAAHAEASGLMYACQGGRDGRVVDGGGLENH